MCAAFPSLFCEYPMNMMKMRQKYIKYIVDESGIYRIYSIMSKSIHVTEVKQISKKGYAERYN